MYVRCQMSGHRGKPTSGDTGEREQQPEHSRPDLLITRKQLLHNRKLLGTTVRHIINLTIIVAPILSFENQLIRRISHISRCASPLRLTSHEVHSWLKDGGHVL